MGDPKKGESPPTWKLAVVSWMGLFPPLLGLGYGLDLVSKHLLGPGAPLVLDDGTFVLWFKLLLTSLVLVPAIQFLIQPAMDGLFKGWL